MKIYFTASITDTAKKQYLKNYYAIINYLRLHNHEVVADHILQVDELELRSISKEDRLDFHKKIEHWIQDCDFMIAETSSPSISVGYEISLALRLGKPVLILYSTGDPPSLFAYHKNEKLSCEKYTLSNFAQAIHDFIDEVESKSDIRFTFFITPQIAQFLEETALKEKLPKSVYLRKLIEKDMNVADSV
jgi:hypothetical protein